MKSFLMHYGIQGQQWGVRRFQNEDGTLTPEGRERYLKNFEKQADIYNKVVDRMNPELARINKKYDSIDLNDDENNLAYSREVRDLWQKTYRDEVAKDLGADPNSLKGQKWLDEMFGYKSNMDKEVEELEKKVSAKNGQTGKRRLVLDDLTPQVEKQLRSQYTEKEAKTQVKNIMDGLIRPMVEQGMLDKSFLNQLEKAPTYEQLYVLNQYLETISE